MGTRTQPGGDSLGAWCAACLSFAVALNTGIDAPSRVDYDVGTPQKAAPDSSSMQLNSLVREHYRVSHEKGLEREKSEIMDETVAAATSPAAGQRLVKSTDRQANAQSASPRLQCWNIFRTETPQHGARP